MWLLVYTAAILAAFYLTWRSLVALQDQITKLSGDLDALTTEVDNAIADIANLKSQLANVATPEQLAALDGISTKLEAATAALKAGE